MEFLDSSRSYGSSSAPTSYDGCPAGSAGTFSTFGFLTFLLVVINLILNIS
jgi:hypothetical protein